MMVSWRFHTNLLLQPFYYMDRPRRARSWGWVPSLPCNHTSFHFVINLHGRIEDQAVTDVSIASLPSYRTFSDFSASSQSSGSASLMLWMLSSAWSAPLTLCELPTWNKNIKEATYQITYLKSIQSQLFPWQSPKLASSSHGNEWAYQHCVETDPFAWLDIANTVIKENLDNNLHQYTVSTTHRDYVLNAWKFQIDVFMMVLSVQADMQQSDLKKQKKRRATHRSLRVNVCNSESMLHRIHGWFALDWCLW